MKIRWILVLIALLLSGSVRADNKAIKILRVRISPVRLGNGDVRQIIMVDWKNVGKRPVKLVNADIFPYGAGRHPLRSRVRNYTIFSARDLHTILPGHTYREQKRDGFFLSPVFGKARRVVVHIVHAEFL